ncbi:MAG: response regulator transcription factor [Eubacteriales bacterium]|nr:response regulator transcription factor [Eubacteriales bacterium]
MEHELTKDEIAELHQRAALVQSTPNRAISHFIAAGLWEQAANTMAEEGTALLYKGMAETVRQWYGSLPEHVRNSQTSLQILVARCEIHRGEYAAAEILLKQARETFVKLGDRKGEGDALTSLITICHNNNDRQSAAKYVERAQELPLNPMGQVATRLAKAWLCMFEGNWEAVRTNVCDGLSVPYASGDRRADLIGVTYISRPMLAVPGCMSAIQHYCDEVEKNALPDTPWSLGAQALSAWPLLLQGSVNEALCKAEAAAKLRKRLGGYPFFGNDLPIVLSMLYLAREDIESAGSAVKSLIRFTTSEGLNSKGVGMFYLHAAGRALALLGRYDEARIMEQRLAALSDNEPVTEYLQYHLKGLVALLTGHDAEASAVLKHAATLESQLPTVQIGGSAGLLLAQLFLSQGYQDDAYTIAQPIIAEWMVAQTPGYAIFNGQIIKPLLRMLAQKNSVGAAIMLRLFSRDLLSEEESSLAGTNIQPLGELLIEPLTPRECDVLKLLALGRTNLQIGKELYITSETVKSHVSHIFRKLDVNSRTQAANRARELGF